jgi:hypothetical protein
MKQARKSVIIIRWNSRLYKKVGYRALSFNPVALASDYLGNELSGGRARPTTFLFRNYQFWKCSLMVVLPLARLEPTEPLSRAAILGQPSHNFGSAHVTEPLTQERLLSGSSR